MPYKLTSSQVLERTEIDLVASAGTKTVRGIQNLDVFTKRSDAETGIPKAFITIGIVLAVAAIIAGCFLTLTLVQ